MEIRNCLMCGNKPELLTVKYEGEWQAMLKCAYCPRCFTSDMCLTEDEAIGEAEKGWNDIN